MCLIILVEVCWGYNGVFGGEKVTLGCKVGEKDCLEVEGVLGYNGVLGGEKGVWGIMGVWGTNGVY